ncbi:hypothetical protein [Caballeronia sp. Lep1P3]|uniref:hypothetical protein n=1 Tax=Caballeronia sp. Lep1P3 TaxID=2878150 RepID=UPI001FCFE81E|nr:hypothetical protein [Caballeronia sp. Lep1P3]
MPDSAVTRNPDILSDDPASTAKPRRRRADASAACGETLDLFAEDAERATLQAMNTDIRQGTFEGFELPEVFLAAVESTARRRGARPQAAEAEAEAASVSGQTPTPQQGELIADAPAPVNARTKAIAIARPASVASSALSPVADAGGARHAGVLLAVAACAMLATFATGIAQTFFFSRFGIAGASPEERADPSAH